MSDINVTPIAIFENIDLEEVYFLNKESNVRVYKHLFNGHFYLFRVQRDDFVLVPEQEKVWRE